MINMNILPHLKISVLSELLPKVEFELLSQEFISGLIHSEEK